MNRVVGPFNAFAWIVAGIMIVLALLVLLGTALDRSNPHIGINMADVALLVASALLLLPPLWRSIRSSAIHAGRLVIAFVCVYLALFLLPIETHAVKLDMPVAAHN